MKVAVLFSGGKDSVYATHLALSWGWDVQWLSIEPEPDSMMFHHPNINWCKLQSQASGIKLSTIKTNHENELSDLQKALSKLKIDGIVTGAVASEYQKQRIELIGHALNLPTYNPLWHKNNDFLKEMVTEMDVRFVSVSAQGLDKKWLAKKFLPIDVDILQNMSPSLSPYLEGGEGETFVCDAPFFKKSIKVLQWAISFDKTSGKAIIQSAKLINK